MRRILRPTVLAAIAVWGLSACAPPVETVAEEETAPVPQKQSVEPEIVEEEADQDALEGVNLVECDDLERQRVQLPITQQTEAFGEGDFDTAYSMASPSFRAAVPLAAFQQLIDSSYGPLLRTTDLSFDACLIERDLDFATIDARFSQGGLDVFGLRYVVSDTEEGWRIDGASDLQVVGTGT